MDETTAEEYLDDAEQFLENGEYTRAISLLTKVISNFPSDKRANDLFQKWSIFTGNPLPEQHETIPPPVPSNNNILEFIEEIESKSNFWENVVAIKTYPALDEKYGVVQSSTGQKITEYLKKEKILLYSHQAKVFDQIIEGNNVIISTPTASGKTYSFSLPIFDILSQNKDYHAIFLYPTKALINDQLIALKKLESETDILLNIGKYDGDTESGVRSWNLKNSRIILTNPDMLHFHLSDPEFLNYLRSVKFFVIDEAHTYRGIFGTHVSLLIRRLRRRCKNFGNDPQFILATATLGNPLSFSKWLVGKEFQLVNDSGSPTGEKHIILYNPYKSKPPEKLNNASSNILSECILHNLQTICFSLSRSDAEIIREKTISFLKQKLISANFELNNKIISYRGGYSPVERFDLEKKLKNRDILGCSTTNALEVGIDIGSLDTVIVSGYPGSIISTWQQMGRSGRKKQPSIAILVAKYDVVDQFFMDDPDYFFDLRNEDAIVSTSNVNILFLHLCCAAYENPLNQKDDEVFFGNFLDIIIQKSNNKEFFIKDNKIYFNGEGDPHQRVNLRNYSSDTFIVNYRGKDIETMDRLQAYREGYRQAIILHQESKYCVTDIDLQKRVIIVDKVNIPYHTKSKKITNVKIIDTQRSQKFNKLNIFFGKLEIEENINEFHKLIDDNVIGIEKIDLPPLIYTTYGVWITLTEELVNQFSRDLIIGGLNGLKNSIVPVFATKVMTDIKDINGKCYKDHINTGLATIFIYDAIEGGIGFSEYAFTKYEDILMRATKRISSCDCSNGCLGCVYSHKIFENKGINKKIASVIGKWIESQISPHKVDTD